jgi:signal transduction histidine kinase
VTDTGRGIPGDKLDEIFEPFVRVENSFTRSTEGTGLGLAIGRSLSRAMGGDLTVVSTLGHGSVFTLTLTAA